MPSILTRLAMLKSAMSRRDFMSRVLRNLAADAVEARVVLSPAAKHTATGMRLVANRPGPRTTMNAEVGKQLGLTGPVATAVGSDLLSRRGLSSWTNALSGGAAGGAMGAVTADEPGSFVGALSGFLGGALAGRAFPRAWGRAGRLGSFRPANLFGTGALVGGTLGLGVGSAVH